MANFSGFLSTFGQTSGTNDIMSNIVTDTGTWYTHGGSPQSYYYGYMYVGNLLIQFSRLTNNSDFLINTNNQGDSIQIYFPITFDTLFCVLVNPMSVGGSNQNYTVTPVYVNNNSYFMAASYNGTGYIQYIAIGPI